MYFLIISYWNIDSNIIKPLLIMIIINSNDHNDNKSNDYNDN